ncbi:MAG: glycoside hydrolase family 25 protein [Saprospiraceae bacterium]|nr:glycoside hydrolase family 25 protein [Saprospiraceae bacterium]
MKLYLTILCLTLVCLACEGPPTLRLDRYAVHGIDVSHYQSRINWDTVAALPLHFAFVKATEGATYTDSLFAMNWEAMKRIGIRRGAYHFFRPNAPPGEQARHFARTVPLEIGDLPPVLDIEITDGMPKAELVRRLQIWLDIVESTCGVKPIIYSNVHFYNRYLAGHFTGYPLWIARYNEREPTLACGSDWGFWQYGRHGRLPGIKGHVDFNVFSGSLEQLDSLRLRELVELSSLR